MTFYFYLSITDKKSTSEHTIGSGLLGVLAGGFMVPTWLVMGSWPWIRRYLVLYLHNGGTGLHTPFLWYTAGGMVLVSYGILWGNCWGGVLDSPTGLIDICYSVFTLRGRAGAASWVASGMTTLRGGSGYSSSGSYLVESGVALGGMSMLKIDNICFNDAFCSLTLFFSGFVVVELRRAWVRSTATCIAASSDDILGKYRLAGKISVLSETLYSADWFQIKLYT